MIERAAGKRLPGLLLLPLGLATVVVTTQLATNWDATAELATPLVVALAAAGFALARRRVTQLRLDRWAALAAVAVFGIYAGPIVLSGGATFASYGLNSEPAIHFIGIDHAMEHGRDLSRLEPSSYEFALEGYFGAGYPLGANTALGAARSLVGQDVAWTFQPFLAFLVAMTALCLYALLTPVVARRWHRALVVFVAAQPALLYAYSLQGSLKEVAAVWAIALLVALVPQLVGKTGTRTVVPLAVAAGASIAVLSVAIMPWLGLILVAALVLTYRAGPRPRAKATLGQAVTFVALAAVLSYPTLSVAGDLVRVAGDQLTAQSDVTAARGLGNLFGPLHKVQVLGIWLSGDYRVRPVGVRLDLTYVLIGVALASAFIGLAWAMRRRALGPLLYVAISAVGAAYVISRGSPWADGKALMIASPAALLAVMLGSVALLERRRVLAGALLTAAISGGVILSNALAYHDVTPAPRDRLQELADVGKRIDGQGATLYTEYEEYGKHFLRNAAPEGSSEPYQRRYGPLRSGQFAPLGYPVDLDDLTLDHVLYYRTIVLRRSPSTSRPPSIYRRVYTGEWYEIWQRPTADQNRVVEHLPLGDLVQPSHQPPCETVKRLARHARRAGARLAFVDRERSPILIPARSEFPPQWSVSNNEGHVLVPKGPGTVQGSVVVRRPGRYTVWVGGSFGRGYQVLIDDQPIGEVSHRLNGPDQYERAARLRLRRGSHLLTIRRGRGTLRPGSGGLIISLGPVILQPEPDQARRVKYRDPATAHDLCRRQLDWIEIVRY